VVMFVGLAPLEARAIAAEKKAKAAAAANAVKPKAE
jgi:hypothetical protein